MSVAHPAAARRAATSLFAALALLFLGACGEAPPPEQALDSAAVRAQPSLADAERLGVPNARSPLPGLVTAGQPTREQMDSLAAAGFTRFVSLRLPGEEGAGWEESHPLPAGASFARLTVAGAEGLTPEAVEALDLLLAQGAGEPTVLYCGSSNRVGAMLALRARWLEGATAEEAVALGRAAGMTGLEGTVTELVDRAEPSIR